MRRTLVEIFEDQVEKAKVKQATSGKIHTPIREGSKDAINALLISAIISFLVVDGALEKRQATETAKKTEIQHQQEFNNLTTQQKTEKTAEGLAAYACQKDDKCGGYKKIDGSVIRFNYKGYIIDSSKYLKY